jgi:hypothetical protein
MLRSALLLLPALGALTSCGIPATGVVEAGGPASGVEPTVRVYLVANGALVAVPRRTEAPVGVESAVRVLLQGPSEAELAKRMTTELPLPGAAQTFAPSPVLPEDGATPVPHEAARPSDLVKVTTRGDRVWIEVSDSAGELTDLAAAQLLCTAVGAQRVADPGAEPEPVTVTGPGGRRLDGTGAQCPDF